MSINTKSGFEPNQKEFGLHVRSEIARRPAMQVARLIAQRANETAPFAKKIKGDRKRRHIRKSYEAMPDGNLRVGKHSRSIAKVQSTVIEAVADEQGWRGRPPGRTLLKAAHAVSVEEFGSFDGWGEV